MAVLHGCETIMTQHIQLMSLGRMGLLYASCSGWRAFTAQSKHHAGVCKSNMQARIPAWKANEYVDAFTSYIKLNTSHRRPKLAKHDYDQSAWGI